MTKLLDFGRTDLGLLTAIKQRSAHRGAAIALSGNNFFNAEKSVTRFLISAGGNIYFNAKKSVTQFLIRGEW